MNVGVAEVERVFETSCCRLREMVEAVEEAGVLRLCALLRLYEGSIQALHAWRRERRDARSSSYTSADVC